MKSPFRSSLRQIYCFSVSFLSLLTFPLLFPHLHPLFFAPFLAITLLRSPLPSALFQAFLVGILFDLFSTTSRFGLTGLSFALACAILFRKRTHLFEENFSTFPIMTSLISLFSSLCMRVLLLFFGFSPSFSFQILVYELLLQPAIDALYAICFFSLPWYLCAKFYRITKKRREFIS